MSKQRGHVVAVRGRLEMLYDGKGEPKPGNMDEMCRIYDPGADTLSEEMPVQQVLKWGYWEPPKKVGSKAKGRWRTLRDGRRVMVTGARRGAMGATWTGKRYLSEPKDAPSSVSPNYLLRESEGKESIEANDVLGFNYMYVGTHEDIDHDAVDYNKELERLGHAKRFTEEMLADPANADFFQFIDEGGAGMIQAAREDLAGEYRGGGRRPGVSTNVIFTHDKTDAGAGSGGPGGMKVFYAPYDARPKALQDYMGYDLAVDPLSVAVHELHHALGSKTELDMFTQTMSVAVHYSLGNNLVQKNTDAQARNLLGLGTVRASPTKKWPGRRDAVLEHRAATRWLYDHYPSQLKSSIIREMGSDKYAREYWARKEAQIKRWRTSYD